MSEKITFQLPEVFEQYRSVIQDTLTPVVNIHTTERETTLLESKFAGDPYFPASMEYPKANDGTPLKLLAQINFSEVPAHLPYFSFVGILQFYVNAHDDLIGMDFDNGKNQADFRVIYHEEIIQDKSKRIQDFSFVTLTNDELFFPVKQEMGLSFEIGLEALTLGDYRNNGIYKSIRDNIADDRTLIDEFYRLFNGTGHKLDGYPFFAQEDPRVYDEDDQDVNILLLQIDSVKDKISWGDSGVGNFFISKEDLINKDFSKVLYNWDCF